MSEAMVLEQVDAHSRANQRLMVIVATLVFAAFSFYDYWQQDEGWVTDNDSMMRLVMIHDLLAGQSWFDPYQYRMGVEDGFQMHWSRLIDAPIALLVSVGRLFGSDGTALAAIVWPVITFAAALAFLVDCARMYGGSAARLPAIVLGSIALYTTGIFSVGMLDHHNIQVVFALAVLWSFLHQKNRLATGLMAGFAAAIMLSIGVETLHLITISGVGAAMFYVFYGERGRQFAQGFGLAFATTAAITFFATIAPARYAQVVCDAHSVTFAVTAGALGFGLFFVASVLRTPSLVARLAGCAIIVVAGAALAAFVFPQCLVSPLAGLDPLVREHWLDSVGEAASLFDYWHKAGIVATRAITPFLAIAVVIWHIRNKGLSVERVVLLGFVAFSIAIMFWQIRGSIFAVTFAVVPLSYLVAHFRERASLQKTSPRAQVAMIFAWAASANLAWGISAAALTLPSTDSGDAKATVHSSETECTNPSKFATLAAMPKQRILSGIDTGPALLLHTPHHVITGPYHRNADGLLLNVKVLMAEPDEALDLLTRNKIDLFTVCETANETENYMEDEPDGLLAKVASGHVPDWLEMIDAQGALKTYRVTR